MMLPCLMPNAAAMQGAVLGTARRQRRLKAQRAEANSDAEVEEQGGGAGRGAGMRSYRLESSQSVVGGKLKTWCQGHRGG